AWPLTAKVYEAESGCVREVFHVVARLALRWRMPELPDIEAYLHAMRARLVGRRLERIRVPGMFLVRTFEPPLDAAEGQSVAGLRGLGKRIVLQLAGDGPPHAEGPLFLVFHLMIAGRFLWSDTIDAKGPGRITLGTFTFNAAGAEADGGTLILT